LKKWFARLVRVSPAMIVAMLALLVALGGVSTAAQIQSPQASDSTSAKAAQAHPGHRGPRGRRGPRGFRGRTGARGLQGPAGPTGATGATGAPGAPGAKGDKGDPGNPATADGAAVLIGRLINAGGATCLTGSASGVSTTGACSITALRDASGVMPVDRVVRNLRASIPTALANGTRVMLYRPNSGGILLECTIPAAQTTCTNANGASIVAGALLALEIDPVGGGAMPASLGFGYETLSAAGAAVTAAPTTTAKTAASE
jgi:hypothetical protein